MGAAQSCDTIVVTDDTCYLEDFTAFPECWDLIPSSNPWVYNGVYLSSDYSYNECSSDAITPVFDISAVTTPYLRFAYRKHNNGGGYVSPGDYLTISYLNVIGSDTAWVPIVTFTSHLGDWRYDSVALPADMSRIRLKFTCITRNPSYGICIDNIMIYNNIGNPFIPVDPSLSTKSVTELTEHSATMHATTWNPYYIPITHLGFAWKSASDSIYTIIFSDTTPIRELSYSPAYTLEGLDESETYNYRAFITYNDTTVFGDVMTFTTFPTVITGPVTGVTNHLATMHATASISNPYDTLITTMGFEWKVSTDSIYTIANIDTLVGQSVPYSMEYTLTDLVENTEYACRAFITYNDITVFGNEMTFTTYGCDAPTGLHSTDVGLDFIVLEWDDNTNVNTWQVWVFSYGGITYQDEMWITETNIDTFHYIFIYEPYYGHSALYYKFAVHSDCGDGVWGAWSDTITVATPYVGIEEQLQNAVTLYPNPATSYVNVRVDGDVDVTGMDIYDVYGKVVRIIARANHYSPLQTTRIDISNLSAGMYFIRINTDHGLVIKPFVKQ